MKQVEQITATGGVITLVHFFTEEGRIACMPNMVEFGETPYHSNYQLTNLALAATCPMCKSVICKKISAS